MSVRSGLLAGVASVLLLAGCATAPPLPASISEAEAQDRVDRFNDVRWQSMFPDEPMPSVEPIAYSDPRDSRSKVLECLKNSRIEGLSFGPNLSWEYSGDAEGQDSVNRAEFICSLQYPVDLSIPGRSGMLTEAELDWIWNFNQDRLMPCMRQLGYTVVIRPHDDVRDYWYPYFQMVPTPSSEREWALIYLHCPPSPIGPAFQPTVG